MISGLTCKGDGQMEGVPGQCDGGVGGSPFRGQSGVLRLGRTHGTVNWKAKKKQRYISYKHQRDQRWQGRVSLSMKYRVGDQRSHSLHIRFREFPIPI